MLKFGKNPPRLPESFGVAGLLSEGCHVFYSTLFSTRHVGRVSDLLSAKLLSLGLDELRFRALLLFTVFEAYRGQASASFLDKKQLIDGLVLECGKDQEKVAVGLSFIFQEGDWPDISAMASRIANGKPVAHLERLLVDLHRQADRLIVRYQAEARRFEVVSLLGIPGQIDEDSVLTRAPIEFMDLGKKAGETPRAQAYTDLGDLDYPKLLADDAPGKKEKPISVADILVRSFGENEHESRVKGEGGSAGGSTLVEGEERDRTKAVHIIHGRAEVENPTSNRIGSLESEESREEGAFGGKGQIRGSDTENYREKIRELEEQVRVLKGERTTSAPWLTSGSGVGAGKAGKSSMELSLLQGNEGSDGGTENQIQATGGGEAKESGGWGFFKRIWPFKSGTQSGKSVKAAEPTVTSPKEGPAAEGSGPSAAAPAAAAPADEGIQSDGVVDEKTIRLFEDIQSGGLEQTIRKAQADSSKIQDQLPSGRTRRWVDMLISELVREKAHLNEDAKILYQGFKSKELEFKRKEMGFLEELRRRDEAIRLKNNALTRTKEQLSQLSIQVDKFKTAGEGGEDKHFKQKHEMSKKMLALSREENRKLSDKIDDLKNQLAAAQLASTKRGSGASELSTLVSQNERLQKQVEEFKKTNQQLMERFNEIRRERTSSNASIEEMKKKFELASKQAATSKREAEKLQLKVEELLREEQRLKIELSHSQMELKKQKKGSSEGSGPSRKGPASAA